MSARAVITREMVPQNFSLSSARLFCVLMKAIPNTASSLDRLKNLVLGAFPIRTCMLHATELESSDHERNGTAEFPSFFRHTVLRAHESNSEHNIVVRPPQKSSVASIPHMHLHATCK